MREHVKASILRVKGEVLLSRVDHSGWSGRQGGGTEELGGAGVGQGGQPRVVQSQGHVLVQRKREGGQARRVDVVEDLDGLVAGAGEGVEGAAA